MSTRTYSLRALLALLICALCQVAQAVEPEGEPEYAELLAPIFNTLTAKAKQGKFKGQKLKGKLDGMGAFQLKDGSIYVGDVTRDEISGYGMLIGVGKNGIANAPESRFYVGSFQKGEKSGRGVCYAENGDILYEGAFAADAPSGSYPAEPDAVATDRFFSLLSMDAACYIGEFAGSRPHGFGIICFANGDFWASRFAAGERKGIGLYMMENGEWEIQNCTPNGVQTVSSSEYYRNIDQERKAVFRESMNQALSNFAQALYTTAELAASISNSGSEPIGDATVSDAGSGSGSASGSRSKSAGSSKSNQHTGSEVQNKNSDSNTYGKYETQIIRMKTGVDDYDDRRRRDIQSKMKKIRQKWESRGFRFYHSDAEDWGGK